MQKKNLFLVKFVTVAMALGFYSPAVETVSQGDSDTLEVSFVSKAEARGGRGGGHAGRGGGGHAGRGNVNRSNVNRSNVNRSNVNRSNVNRNTNRNVNRNTNRNVNRNTNRNTNINIDNDRYYGGSYNRGGYYGAGAVVAGVVTGLAIGSIVASVPTTCTTVYANGIAYRNCSGTYYEPYYQGSTVSYRVVNSPY